jgi:hypothetical protein
LSSSFGDAPAVTSVAGFEGVTGWGCGVDTVVDLGVEVFRCSGFTSWGGFGVGRFGGPACGIGVGAVTGLLSSLGVAAL